MTNRVTNNGYMAFLAVFYVFIDEQDTWTDYYPDEELEVFYNLQTQLPKNHISRVKRTDNYARHFDQPVKHEENKKASEVDSLIDLHTSE